MGQQVRVGRELIFEPGAIVKGSWNGSYDTGGTTYYVNNITGSSTADGLSWNSAVDEVTTAITLSEASRLVHPGTTTNDYIRNKIIIQGTGTAYSALTNLPSYCDVIGLGAYPRGDGTGIAVIKGTDADGAVVTGVRGVNLYNLQFAASGGSSYNAMKATGVFLRSVIQDCAFMGSTANSSQALNAGFTTAAAFAGNIVRDCQFGGTNGTYATSKGFEISASVSANNNLFKDNVFFGVVTAMLIHATTNDNGTVIDSNLFHSHLGETECTTSGLQMGAHSTAIRNIMVGADAITEAAAAQTVFNWISQAAAATIEDPS